MKRLFIVLLASVLGLAATHAQKSNDLVISAGQLKHLVIGDDLNVVLVPANGNALVSSISESLLNKLQVTFSGRSMQISAGARLEKNETVYVLIGGLQSLTLGENSNVNTKGIIRSAEIKVYLNEGASARIRTTAKVKGYSMGDFDISLTKFPLSPDVIAVR